MLTPARTRCRLLAVHWLFCPCMSHRDAQILIDLTDRWCRWQQSSIIDTLDRILMVLMMSLWHAFIFPVCVRVSVCVCERDRFTSKACFEWIIFFFGRSIFSLSLRTKWIFLAVCPPEERFYLSICRIPLKFCVYINYTTHLLCIRFG